MALLVMAQMVRRVSALDASSGASVGGVEKDWGG